MLHDDSTRSWLDSRTDEQLETLLELRPDLSLGATLADLDDLAARLEHPMSVSSVVMNLPRPAVELLEVLTALDTGATTARAAELLDDGGRGSEEHLGLVLHWASVLEMVGLAWEGLHHYRVNPGAHRVVVNPLLMGSPARVLAKDLTVDRLKTLYSGLGMAPPPRKAELLAGLGELYADPSRIRRALAQAPDRVATMLAEHAAAVARDSMAGPASRDEEDQDYPRSSWQRRYQEEQAMHQWAVQHGLAIGAVYAYSYSPVSYPSEVMLALVPPTYRAPFHPRPPTVPVADVSEVQTERDSAAAVTGTVAAILAVLESTLRTPIQELKSGGVGARELKRVAKSVGVDGAEVRLALELGVRCQFFPRGVELRAAGEFEQWRRLAPHERAAELLLAWWLLNVPPTLERDEDDKALPALSERPVRGTALPPQLVAALHTVDGPVPALEPLLESLGWARPLDQPPTTHLHCTWDEAARLGVIRDGRLTHLGQALVTGERAPVVERLRELLPEESAEVLFGSDLTVVAPGSPPAAVVDLLDSVAVRESHGVGATWRLSETSVREALDDGHQLETLLAELRDVCGRALPQTVEYLLRDVARRHGILGVRPAMTVVVSQDEALLAEVAATKALRSLGLAAVAPTVLVGTADAPTTLAALRKAGYFPVEQHTDGTRTVALRSRGPMSEAPGEQQAAELPGDRAARDVDTMSDEDLEMLSDVEFNALMERDFGRLGIYTESPSDGPGPERPDDLVARLRSGQVPAHSQEQAQVQSIIAVSAPQLRLDEQRHLAAAAAASGAVVIRYRNESGNESERLVSGLMVSGGYLIGHCHLRQDERFFRLDRITMVAPTA